MADHTKIAASIKQLEKAHGAGAVIRLGNRSAVPVVIISTGVLSIDNILGIGGFARGRTCEVYGPESGGKTTLALQVIAQAQSNGGAAGFIDAEHALDLHYAAALGVDTKNLYVSQPDNGEQALEIAEGLIESGEFDIIVVDSVAALVPKAELEGEMGQSQMGLQARLMGQAMRKLTGVVSRTKTCLLFINQIREKIGVMYGNPETTTGGRALKFYASQRVEVRPGQAIKDGDRRVGTITRVKVVKNKFAPPYQETEVKMIFGQGFNPLQDLLDVAIEQGVVEQAHAWLKYGVVKWQGRDEALEQLASDSILAAQLLTAVRAKLFPEATVGDKQGG